MEYRIKCILKENPSSVWVIGYKVQVKFLFFWITVKRFGWDGDYLAYELLDLLKEKL